MSAMEDYVRQNAARWVQIALVLISLAFVGLFFFIAVWHLCYPYEIEWYEGVTMDHAMRVATGLPIYLKPDVYFSAMLYQPLYFYLVAPVIHLMGASFLAGRLVTVLATLATAVVVAKVVSGLTERSKFAIVISLGLFFSTYALTDYVQTVVRIDSLYVFLVVCAVYVLSFRTYASSVLGALLLAAAYFTKQEALFFMPLPLLWLFAIDKRKAMISAGVLALAIGACSFALQHYSHGWYTYYVYAMPRAKAQYFGYLRVLAAFPMEILRYWGVGILLIGLFVGVVRRRLFLIRSVEGLWALGVLSAIVQVCAHRGDQMSGNNILYPLSTMMAVFLSYIIWRVRSEGHSLAVAFEWGVVIQLLVFVYDPRAQPMMLPGAQERAAGDNFIRYLRNIPGDVVIPAHGFIGTLAGKRTHTHCQVENDVIVMHDSNSAAYLASWLDAYRDRKFSAIIWDESPIHRLDSIPGYTLVGKLRRESSPASKMGPSIVYPSYVFVPKQKSD